MAERFFDLAVPNNGMNYRWVQPPQIAYFINTLDRFGNVNTTPATLGTCVSVDMEPEASGNFFFTFSLGHTDLPHVPKRQSVENLEDVPECTISFIGAHLVRESQVIVSPIPRGISEIDVAGLTPLPSRHIRPPGIRECGVNLEVRIAHVLQLGTYYRHYVGQVVGVSVDEALLKRGDEVWPHAGTFAVDPLFEINVLGIENGPPRLYFIRLDPKTIERMPDDVGPTRTWVGTFPNWMEDEVARGALTPEEKDAILDLYRCWMENTDPATNGEVKAELTASLAALTARKTGGGHSATCQ